MAQVRLPANSGSERFPYRAWDQELARRKTSTAHSLILVKSTKALAPAGKTCRRRREKVQNRALLCNF